MSLTFINMQFSFVNFHIASKTMWLVQVLCLISEKYVYAFCSLILNQDI